MTNREYLNTLPNDKFADLVLAKTAEFEEKNFDPEADIWEIVNDTQMDFEDWLAEEYKDEVE